VRGSSPTAIRERLIAELEGFQVGAQADDTAMVAMRFTGDADGAGAFARSVEPAVRA